MLPLTIKKKLLLLFFFPSMTGLAQSLPQTEPKLWNLESCLQYAKEHNIQIKNLKLTKQTADQDKTLSKAAMLPDLYGSVSQSFNHINSDNGTINSSGVYGLNSSWIVYQGGYLKNDLKQKDLSVQSAGYTIQESENDITLQITQIYLAILADKENITYNKTLVATSEAQLDQMKRRFNAGSAAQKDVAQLEAQLATDKYNLTISQNTEQLDKIALKQLLQLPRTSDFDIVKPDTIITDTQIPDINSTWQYAELNRPEIKIAKLGVQISDLNFDKAKAGYSPSLTLGASTGTNYSQSISNSIFKQFDNNFYQQIGLNLSIPLFTKKLNLVNTAKAKIGIEESTLSLENEKTILSFTIEKALINVQNAQKQLLSANEQLRYSTEIYRIANEELKIGAVNIVDFYQQRNLYVQAMRIWIQAKYSAILTTLTYKFYIGVPVKL